MWARKYDVIGQDNLRYWVVTASGRHDQQPRKHARPVRRPGLLLVWRQRGAPRHREDTGGLCEGGRGNPGGAGGRGHAAALSV